MEPKYRQLNHNATESTRLGLLRQVFIFGSLVVAIGLALVEKAVAATKKDRKRQKKGGALHELSRADILKRWPGELPEGYGLTEGGVI
jgi:hypothetical protein